MRNFAAACLARHAALESWKRLEIHLLGCYFLGGWLILELRTVATIRILLSWSLRFSECGYYQPCPEF